MQTRNPARCFHQKQALQQKYSRMICSKQSYQLTPEKTITILKPPPEKSTVLANIQNVSNQAKQNQIKKYSHIYRICKDQSPLKSIMQPAITKSPFRESSKKSQLKNKKYISACNSLERINPPDLFRNCSQAAITPPPEESLILDQTLNQLNFLENKILNILDKNEQLKVLLKDRNYGSQNIQEDSSTQLLQFNDSISECRQKSLLDNSKECELIKIISTETTQRSKIREYSINSQERCELNGRRK